MSLATGPIVSIFTHSLYNCINEAKIWESFVKLDSKPLAKEKIAWWVENIKSVSKYPIGGSLSSIPTQAQVASDSSSVGLFSYNIMVGDTLAKRAFPLF